MKQVIRQGLKKIIVDEVPDPVVSKNHVLLRPLYSLISSGTETADIHTDSILKEVAENPSHLQTVWNVMKKTDPISTYNEVRAKFNDYAVLGYSGAGVIVDLGHGISDLSIGQRVAYGGEGTGHGETINVGRNLVARVPDNVGFAEAAFTTVGAIAMNSVRLAKIGVGDVVAVVGLGLVGQLVAQIARCQGGIVIAIDLDKERVELACSTGAHYGLSASDGLVSQVRSITDGRGADGVIVAAASSSPEPLRQSISMSREKGRVVMVGSCPIEIPRAEMYLKELTFTVSRAYGPGSYDPSYEKGGVDYPVSFVRWTENRNMEAFLRLISLGAVNVKPLVSHEFELDDAANAYEVIMTPRSRTLGVLLRYPVDDARVAPETFNPTRTVYTGHRSNQERDVRIAVVGAGNLAKWAHLPALKKISGASIHAICSNSGARGKSYAQRFGAHYATSDYGEVLNDPDVNAVVIVSRHKDHAQQVIAALNAGKHVFVEKPMAVSVDECRSIYKATQNNQKQLMVGFNRRFAPYYSEIKDQLKHRSGPIVVSTRMNSPGIEMGWAAEESNGGVVLGEGCHFIDLAYWLVGSELAGVSAYKLDENNIVASLKFDDGSVGSFVYTVVGGEASAGESVEVFAPGVAFDTEDFKSLVVKGKNRKSSKRWFAAKGYLEQMQAFVESVRTGKNLGASVIDGARATLGCLLMLESAETGKPLELDVYKELNSH